MLIRILTLFILLGATATVKSQCFLVPSEVCVGQCGPVFYLQSDPPETTYQWSISCGTITNDTLANPHTVCFTASGTCTIEVIIQIPGEVPDTCSTTVEVLPPSLSVVIDNACEGDSVEINGMYYTPGFYLDTILGGSANGCDSILLITVNSVAVDTTNISYNGCEGDSFSVVVNNEVYNEINPTGTEVLTGSEGCDSIVNINLVFLPNSLTEFTYTGCLGDTFSITFNNVVYNESNPTGMDTLTAANGCDSIISVNLSFFDIIRDTIEYFGCSGDGFSVMVGDSIYNEDNPTGIDTFFGGCDTIVVINLQFDTLIAALTLTGNQMCASPAGMNYTWITCDSIPVSDTTECITVTGLGCVCVIVDNGICADTVCLDYDLCDVTCDINAPPGSCLGDSVLLSAITNASGAALLTWTITLDSFAGVVYTNVDSIWTAFNSPGCYTIDLVIQDQGCITSCSDTLCVSASPLADLCCDVIACDTCATLNVYLFGNPPWEIAISDGNTIDTITGITNSQYDYVACPPFNTNVVYTLLWVRDSLGYCEGGVINDTASVYIESRPVASIATLGDTLCAGPIGLAYNWSDCANTSNLGNDRCFIPTASGCYCVTVSTLLTDCIDTACVNFVLTGINVAAEGENYQVWYDRDQHAVLIRGINQLHEDFDVQLSDLQGRTMPYRRLEWIDTELVSISLQDQMPSMLIISAYSKAFRYTKGVFIPTY